jgi:hypothetical protein
MHAVALCADQQHRNVNSPVPLPLSLLSSIPGGLAKGVAMVMAGRQLAAGRIDLDHLATRFHRPPLLAPGGNYKARHPGQTIQS